MAIPFDRQKQLELEAEAELELEREDLANAARRGGQSLGPDYNLSGVGNVGKATLDLPRSVIHMAKDAYNLFDLNNNEPNAGLFDVVANAGVDKTARTVGPLASGTAGAMIGAPVGAQLGAFTSPVTGPFGPLLGGLLGAGLGFGAGALGFDITKDLATGENPKKSYSEYLKDFIYNSTQATELGGLGKIAKAPISAGRRAITGVGPEGVDARAGTELTKLDPNIVTKIDEAYRTQAQDPFLSQKSVGELIDSDALRSAQRVLAGSEPTKFGKWSENNAARNTEQLSYLDKIEPVGPDTASLADAQSTILSGLEKEIAGKQSAVSSAEAAVESNLNKLPASIDKAEAGALAREGIQQGLDKQKGIVKKEFGGVGDGIVNEQGIKDTAQAEMSNYFRETGSQPAGELVKFLEKLNKEEAPVTNAAGAPLLDAQGNPIVNKPVFTMQDMQAMRSEAIAMVKGLDPRSAAIAGQIISAIDKAVQDAVKAGTVTKEQVASWEKGIAERQKQGAIYEHKRLPAKSILQREYSGEPTVPDSAVPAKIFKPGAKNGARESIQNYKQAYGESAEALDPIYRYAADSFREQVVRDGKVDIKALRKWRANHAEALSELPRLDEQLSSVEKSQSFLNEKFGDLKRTEAETQKGALKLWLGGVEPEAAIKAMLSGKDAVRKTVATVQYVKANDAAALAGLRRGVIEYLKEKTFIPSEIGGVNEALQSGKPFKGNVLSGTLAGTIGDLMPILEKSKLFTDSQLKMYEALYKEVKSKLSVENAKMPRQSNTAQDLSTLNSLLRASGREFIKGLPSGRYVVLIEKVLSAIPQAKVVARLEEALLDPKLARDLANKATTKNFIRGAESVFGAEISGALGATKDAIKYTPVIESNRQKKAPSQQSVTAKESFPDPKKLLNPPAKGAVQKTSFNVDSFIKKQSPETQARINVESTGNPYAVSRKGAQGLSQLMPNTAQYIAQQLGETYIPLKPGMTPEQQKASIEQNVRFGDWYFQQQLKRFNNPSLAWAAYNAGPSRVANAMKMAGSDNDVNAILSKLPKDVQAETVPYVQKIAALYGRK